jgi:hypothetical protein
MADPSQYTYESPLKGWENLPPLGDEKAADGKSKKSKMLPMIHMALADSSPVYPSISWLA